MSNNSNNDVFFWIAVLFFFAIIAWVAKSFGLNFTTAIQVVMGHICFIVWIGVVTYLVKNLNIRWILFLPFSAVLYLVSWEPAFDYWASKDIESIAFRGSASGIWYATGWIQALIALSILVVGHGLIYFFSSDKDHWLFD